jgi:hypothetical protein
MDGEYINNTRVIARQPLITTIEKLLGFSVGSVQGLYNEGRRPVERD